MIQGMIGGISMGDCHPVRLMGVVNLSRESFYRGSVAGPEEALSMVRAMQEQGANLIDVGAVSTAPGSPPVDETTERERLLPALEEILDNLDIPVSVDTQRSAVAGHALSLGAACINDVSGLLDPSMAGTVAEYDGSLIIMASDRVPGDLLHLNQIIPLLGERVRTAVNAGVSSQKITVDPGIGKWIPEKTPEHDLAILDGFRRLRVLDRPILAALSRKSFIGHRLRRSDPEDRLAGSLAATAIAVYNGAHIVRTHDVSASLDVVRMAQAIRGLPALAGAGELEVEVLDHLGQGPDLTEGMRRAGVDERGWSTLVRKSSFRVLVARGLSSMEAVIIKQEMLARGGDAAIPKLALRCDPGLQEVIIFGTMAQISGLEKNLQSQPFRLPQLAAAMQKALERLESPERYR
jgi:dihydropteroate synthase